MRFFPFALLLLQLSTAFAQAESAVNDCLQTETPLSCLKDRALQGDADAQFAYGQSLFLGKGQSRNPEEALNWLMKAAEQGQEQALVNLGYCFHEGIGTSKDLEQSLVWLELAAIKGNSKALYNLGMAYMNGEGCPQDEWMGTYFLEQAAGLGHINAMLQLGEIYSKGKGRIARDDEAAQGWYTQAADSGDERARRKLIRLTPRSLSIQTNKQEQMALHALQKQVKIQLERQIQSDCQQGDSQVGMTSVEIDTEIDPSGQVVSAQVQSFMPQRAVAKCIEDAFKAYQFKTDPQLQTKTLKFRFKLYF